MKRRRRIKRRRSHSVASDDTISDRYDEHRRRTSRPKKKKEKRVRKKRKLESSDYSSSNSPSDVVDHTQKQMLQWQQQYMNHSHQVAQYHQQMQHWQLMQHQQAMQQWQMRAVQQQQHQMFMKQREEEEEKKRKEEERKKEEEERLQRIEEAKEKAEAAKREEAAQKAIMTVIMRMRCAIPETIDALRQELDEIMERELDHTGAQKEELLEEKAKALEQAQRCIVQIKALRKSSPQISPVGAKTQQPVGGPVFSKSQMPVLTGALPKVVTGMIKTQAPTPPAMKGDVLGEPKVLTLAPQVVARPVSKTAALASATGASKAIGKVLPRGGTTNCSGDAVANGDSKT